MINLWHQKFITPDVTAVFVNNQHGIQRRGQDFDKKTHKYTQHTQLRRGIKIGAFIISQGSVAPCVRWGG